MQYQIYYSCISHPGNYRNMNQDNFVCGKQFMETESRKTQKTVTGQVPTEPAILFGVFDGMGGEERGEIASLLAASRAAQVTFEDDALNELSAYCVDTNKAICDYASKHAVSSMGTTAAMLAFTGQEIILCNIGDSKIFRCEDGEMEQISQDHVSVSAYGTKPPLSQNLGIPPTELLIEPYMARGDCKHRDRYLICSDGLTDMLTLDEIRHIMKNSSVQNAAQTLVDKAIEQGGKDNITVIVCEVKRQSVWPWNKRRKV